MTKVKQPEWWKVLGVAKFANAFKVNEAYEELKIIHDPDNGGDEDKLKEVEAAYNQWKNE